MKPDAMEKDLQTPEVEHLKAALTEIARERQPSEFACECSWTRLRTCLLEENRSSDLHLWRWTAIGSCALLVLLLTLARNGSPDAPVAESRNPQIWVSGFHSAPAQADVVWATGYDYLPASYRVK
ncbi:MAG: hypothetical protein SFU85_08070 [Candidatus Methylacidiphilales bacterium]|nr:hypothetical protein [Candidatus Methylacidiphilales bacterium]